METMGSRIRQRRGEKGWSLPKLSDEAGIAKGYLWELESDKAAKPSAASLFKIAKALGTTVADLLGEAPQVEQPAAIPPELEELAHAESLTADDVAMLAGISYRGERPKTVEDWRFVLESIRRSVKRRPGEQLRHTRNRRTWRSTQAEELLAATGAVDPVGAIQGLAAALLLKGEQASAPTDLELLASIQNVLRVDRLELRESGRLVPTKDGLIIQINSRHSIGRQNFTIAHELGHTLMPSYARQPAFRAEANVGYYAQSDEEEYLCDVAASFLLLPPDLIRPRTETLGPSVASISVIANEFQSSLEATALACTQLNLWPFAVVVWEEKLKPSERRKLNQPGLPGLEPPAPTPRFRVGRFFRSASFPHYLPKDKSVDDDTVLRQAVANGQFAARMSLTGGRQSFDVDCDALYAPYRIGDSTVERVIGLLTPVR